MRRSLPLIALLALSSPAFAEDNDDAIVVTATGTPSPAQRLPADVIVIDIDDARAHGRTTLSEALQAAPGLAVTPSGGAGQVTSLFSGGANSNHTLVLFDGLRLNDPSTPGSSFDAGQDQNGALLSLEVVQGPMSAVFGSDAIGGVVNMIPRHGGEGLINGRMDIAAGSLGALDAMAGIDGTIGRFRYAITGEGYASEGHDLVPDRMSTRTGDEDSAELAAVTGVFDLAINDRLALDLLVRRRTARAEFDPFLFDAFFNEFRADDPDLEIAKNELTVARLGATWDVSDALSLRATGGGMDQTREQTDGGALTDRFDGQRRFGDLTLEWRPGALGVFEDAALVLGATHETEEADIAQGFGFPPPFFFTVAEQDHDGAFLTAQGSLDRLTLTGAVRVDDYEGFGAETTWRAGASFALLQNARIYAAYGTSFRAPTLYERFVSFGDPLLKPERGESWEIGADIGFAAFGREKGVELRALYRATDIEDLIDFGPFFTYANVDKAKIEIAEARASVRPFSWLEARVSYVNTDARDAVANTPLLRRPEDAWSAALRVEHEALSIDLSWRQVGARADQIYGDDGFALGVGETPAYDVTRLSVAYSFQPGIQAYVAANNLFDATYEPVNAFAGAPQTIMIGLRLKSGD